MRSKANGKNYERMKEKNMGNQGSFFDSMPTIISNNSDPQADNVHPVKVSYHDDLNTSIPATGIPVGGSTSGHAAEAWRSDTELVRGIFSHFPVYCLEL